jgi:hypothetical protein
MKDILREHPALVLTSAETYDVPSKGSPLSDAQSVGALIRGYHKVWTELVAAGIPVAVIEDTPVPNFDMVGCVETHPRHLLACAGPRANFFPKVNALHRAAATDPHVTDLDFNNLICPWSRCAGVIGNVLVWRDNHHLSNTYAVSLHEAVGQRIAALLHRPKGRH